MANKSIDLQRQIEEANEYRRSDFKMPQDNADNESDVASENEYEPKEEQEDAMPENSCKAESQNGGDQRDVKKPKLDPKDPLRPRRKKARRACFACQRAHLTCGMCPSDNSHRFSPLFCHFRCQPVGNSLPSYTVDVDHHDNHAY